MTCEVRGRDRWRRALATCFAGGLDLARELVRRVWAVAWIPHGGFPGPDYAAEEAETRTARRGISRSRFLRPWRWRHGER